jgi:hypothetical protein
MKWKTVKHVPKDGHIRTRRVFAWLPTEVEDHTVWLEQYQVTEQYFHGMNYWHELSTELLYVMY